MTLQQLLTLISSRETACIFYRQSPRFYSQYNYIGWSVAVEM